MSPATTMDTTLPSSNSALFNIPKLADDSLNWITDGHKVKPDPFEVDSTTKKLKKPDGTTPTDKEIEDLDDLIDEYHQKDSLVKQQILSTITDQLLLRVQSLGSASKIWSEVCKIH
ncbi:hypothetical protein M405DRAFT_769916, partial [Rhizopogon salebrosus TDB-379]